MTLAEVVSRFEEMADPKVGSYTSRNTDVFKQYGVKLGDLRKLAKEIKPNHDFALELWQSRIADAMLLSTLIMIPKRLSLIELEEMVREASFVQLADWVNSYLVKAHPLKEEVRERWMNSEDAMLARSGWSITAERIAKNPSGLNIHQLLDRIEQEMGTAPVEKQWTMNFALAEIGINFPDHRQRAIQIGETLGVFRDYPTSKGCTSPFAPTWIEFMVNRANA